MKFELRKFHRQPKFDLTTALVERNRRERCVSRSLILEISEESST
ncbi:MAG: hypothetical protein ACXABO_06450 [Promethearchaeota archaeon]